MELLQLQLYLLELVVDLHGEVELVGELREERLQEREAIQRNQAELLAQRVQQVEDQWLWQAVKPGGRSAPHLAELKLSPLVELEFFLLFPNHHLDPVGVKATTELKGL